MKKLTILISMFVLILTLGACDQISSVIDEVDPTISGIEDVTIAVGASFNVMDGVTANDDQDGDITSLITYTITDEIGNPVSIDLNAEGVYYIRYTVSDEAGNTVTADRKLTINATGQSDDIVHVLLDSLVSARQRLEEFYNDVLDSNLTVQEVCDKYIGDVPFPINNSDIDGCNEGLQEVRGNYVSVVVGTVQISNYEGHSVYEASVEVTLSEGQPYTGTVVYAFLTKESLTEEYIHFYGDPFAHDGGGNNIDTTTAQQQLEMFYDSFFDVNYDVSLFCTTYLYGLMPNEDCENFIMYAREMVDNISVISVNETQVTFPDNTQGSGFLAYIEVFSDGELIGFDLYFFFVEDPNTGEIVLLVPLNDPLGNAFTPDLGYIVVPQSQARTYIESFYENILSYDVDLGMFCTEYIGRSTIPGPNFDECLSTLEKMRQDVLYLEITVLYQGEVAIAPEFMIPGYTAEIYYETQEGNFTVMVPFFFIDADGIPYPVLLSGPLGDNQGGLDLVQIPEPDAQALLDEFYLMIEDPYSDLGMFCQNYFDALMMPYGPEDIPGCTESLNNMRSMLITHMVYDASPTYIQSEFVSGNGYVANVELHLQNNEVRNFSVEFGFVEYNDMIHIVIISNPMGEENHGGFDTIYVPLPDALPLIEEFYGWLFAIDTPVHEVCNEYMQYVPGDFNYDQCEEVVNHMRTYIENFVVIDVYEGPIDMGGENMDGYYAVIQFDDLFNAESVQVEVPFVFISYMDMTKVIMLGHPLGYEENGGGEYLFLVPVPLSEVEFAVDNFYTVIADPSFDLYTFCDLYMSQLPFPFDSNEVQNCADGLMNMRMGLQTHQIINVFETYITWDGIEGTAYEVDLELTDQNNQVHPISVIVGFIEIPDGTAFIMLTNPGGEQNGGPIPLVDVFDLDAIQYLFDFLFDVNNSGLNLPNMCMSYLEFAPTYMDQMMCENEWDDFRNMVIGFNVVDIFVDYRNDNMYVGPIFEAEVEYNYNDGTTDHRILRLGFIDTPNGIQLVLFSSIFGEEMPREYNIFPVSLPDAEFILNNMYTSLLTPVVSVEDFCIEYINDDPYGPSFEECFEAIDGIRQNYMTFTIDGLVEEGVPVGPDYFLPGFHAFITLDGPAGPVSIDVLFLITDNNYDGVAEFIFLSHPAGENDMGEFITIPMEEADMYLNMFYGELLDEFSYPVFVCDMYIVNSPFTNFDPVSCVDFVTSVQQMGIFYTVDMIQPETIQLPDSNYAEGYRGTVTLIYDGNVPYTLEILFGFIGTPNGPQIIFFTENFVEGGPGQSMYADLGLIDAENWVVQYYDALSGGAVYPSLFCQVYLNLEDSMQPMDPLTCENIKLEYENMGYVFTVSNGVFYPETMDSPPYFTFDIERNFNGESIFYQASFIFLLDPNGQVLLATPFNQAVGANIDPPVQLPYVNVQIGHAQTTIQELYFDAGDVSIDTDTFCTHYTENSPVDLQFLCNDFETFRMLDTVYDYTIDNVVAVYHDGILHYRAFITEIGPNVVNPFTVDFAFIEGVNGSAIIYPIESIVKPSLQMITDETLAEQIIQDFYYDLFSGIMSDQEFCDMYYTYNVFYEGTNQDCLDGRTYALTRTEHYIPMFANEDIFSPYMSYYAYVAVTLENENGGNTTVLTYELYYSVFMDESNIHLLIRNEIIRDVQLP